MKKGTVKFYNSSKGYGFIIPEDSNEEVFVHASALKQPIQQNDNVLFEVEKGKRGLNAVNVKVS